MGMLRKEPRLVTGQKIHKVRCLPMLEFFKKLMWHGNSWGLHVLFGPAGVQPSEDKTF
jgi:hypothetical protein